MYRYHSVKSTILTILLCVNSLFSNNNDIQKLNDLYHDVKERYRRYPDQKITLKDITVNHEKLLSLEKKRAETAILHHDPGIKFSGGYRHDLIADKASTEDDGNVWLQLQYNILKNGLLEKRRTLELSERKIAKDSVEYEQQKFKFQCEAYKKEVELKQLQLFNEMSKGRDSMYTLMFQLNGIDYSYSKKDNATLVESLLQRYTNREQYKYANTDAVALNYSELIPVYQIDIDSAISLYNTSQISVEAVNDYMLEKGDLLSESQLNVYLKGARYYGAENANDLVAGITFSMPVRYVHSIIAEYNEKAENILKRKSAEVKVTERESLRLKLLQYNQSLQELKISHYKLDELESKIESLISHIKSHGNSVKDVIILGTTLQKWFTELEKDLSKRVHVFKELLSIMADSKLPQIMTVLKPLVLNESMAEILHVGERSIYISYDEFIEHDAEFLMKFCKVKNIKTILVSYPKRADEKAVGAFIKYARLNRVRVELMFTSTEWVQPEKFEQVQQRITEAVLLEPDGLHLDVEPHIIENWRNDNYKVLDNYIKLLIAIREIYTGYLSVSVPVIFPDDYYADIYSYVNMVHFMVYGKQNNQKIHAKIREWSAEYQNRTALSLRCSDFANELSFEDGVQKIYYESKFEKITLFDLSRYQEMLLK